MSNIPDHLKVFEEEGWTVQQTPWGGWSITGAPKQEKLPWSQEEKVERLSATQLTEQRKRDGRCVICGDLLPMTAFGLGECPLHPGGN